MYEISRTFFNFKMGRILVLVLLAFLGYVLGAILQFESTRFNIALTGLVAVGIGSGLILSGLRQKLAGRIAQTAFRLARLIAPALVAFGLFFAISAITVFDLGSNDKEDRAFMTVDALTIAAKAFEQRNGVRPDSLQQVEEVIEGGFDMRDPWGRSYQYDRDGPRNNGKQPDIWTVSPNRQLIGNWTSKRQR